MAYVLSLDSGTTSCRAVVYADDATVCAVAQREIEQHYPRPGWVEHDADEIWAAEAGVATEALSRAHVRPRDVAAIGITNQRETAVVWERATGRPIHRAIVWQDRRTAGRCDELRRAGAETLVRERTGLVLDSYFSATKIEWILDHVPGARRRAEAGELAFGTIDSWLVWRLSDGAAHITDATNASRTLLFNIHAGTWDDELLALFRVPRAVLPEVRPSSEVYAHATIAGGPGVPIAGIAGDQQAALFGQLCTAPGQTKTTYGTGCFTLQHTGEHAPTSAHRLLGTVALRAGGATTYALEGSIFMGGATVQWLRDGLGIIRSSDEVEALAASVPDAAGVVMVPAFTGLGAPHWDPSARAIIAGMTRGTTRAHIARAALEGIAHQVVDVLEAMQADSGLRLPEMRVDGAACRNDLLMQLQADLLGVRLVRPADVETTALGAAFLAGLGMGLWKDTAQLATQQRISRTFEPRLPGAEVGVMRERWRVALERARGWTP